MSVSSDVESSRPEEIAKMHQRPIVAASKRGSISRLQARTAAKAVKMAKSTGGANRKGKSSSKAGQLVSESVLERYLGHFGVGRSKTGAKKASGMKNSAATKSRAKHGRKVDDA